MTLNERPYANEADMRRMIALARVRPDDNLHVVDLPYRLSSWALDDPDSIHLWEDAATGELVMWAMLQPPMWTMDIVIGPPDSLRERLRCLTVAQLLHTCAGMRGSSRQNSEEFATVMALRATARRALACQREAAELEAQIDVLVRRIAPAASRWGTPHDLREIALSSAGLRLPAPGISRSITNLGMSVSVCSGSRIESPQRRAES